MTRIAQGKVRIQPEPLELGALVRRTMEDHRATFAASGVALESQLPAELLWVSGDPTRLAQVLGNLLGNAVKFTPRGGRGRRRPEVRGGHGGAFGARHRSGHRSGDDEPALPAVQTGAADNRPYARRSGPWARDGQGGRRDSWGKVSVASRGLGRGSTFTVRLPVGIAPAAESPAQVDSEVRRRRILVIDDSVDTANSMRDLLAEEGQDVQVANDGTAGLTLAREFRPQIVFCDVGLPGMMATRSRAPSARTPRSRGRILVAVNGYALAEDRQRARDAGFDRHLAKPTSLESLERILAEAPTLEQ